MNIQKNKKPSKWILISLLIFILISSLISVFVINNSRENKQLSASSCSSDDKDSIYTRAIGPIGNINNKESMNELASLKTEIESLKDFNKDSNCLFILTVYSTFYSSPESASDYYNQLKNNYLASPIRSDFLIKFSVEDLGKLIDNQKSIIESSKSNMRFIR